MSFCSPEKQRTIQESKDLNDKVLKYDLTNQYVEMRKAAIVDIFSSKSGDSVFNVEGQNYKAAYISTMTKGRKDFIQCLRELDAQLRDILLKLLPDAKNDAVKEMDTERVSEIKRTSKESCKKIRSINSTFILV